MCTILVATVNSISLIIYFLSMLIGILAISSISLYKQYSDYTWKYIFWTLDQFFPWYKFQEKLLWKGICTSKFWCLLPSYLPKGMKSLESHQRCRKNHFSTLSNTGWFGSFSSAFGGHQMFFSFPLSTQLHLWLTLSFNSPLEIATPRKNSILL